MSNIIIRKARPDDCPRIMELIKELAEYEKAPEQVTATVSELQEAGFGNDPVWWGYVAETEDHICGFALWYTRYSTWKGRRLYLEDFYVVPQMRGRGIGRQLFEAVIKDARDASFNGMMWQVLDWNTPAIDFYKRYGAAMDSGWINCSLEKEQLEECGSER